MSFRKSGSLLTPLAAAVMAAAGLVSVSAHAGPDAMRVTRDPQTGQLRAPTAEESKSLDAAAAKARGAKSERRVGMVTGRLNPQAIVHADGTVEQELDETSLSYSVAQRKPDGSIEMVCVSGSDAAQKALKAPKFANRMSSQAAKEHQHDK
jgi:hypothetical protein